MAPFAYGASIHNPDNSRIEESINTTLLYIKFHECKEEVVKKRIIDYHRKCIQVAINTDIVSYYDPTKHYHFESMVICVIQSFYKSYSEIESIAVNSKLIETGGYIKHSINFLSKPFFIDLFLSL